MNETDFRLLHEKLDRFEQKLKELETDAKVLKAYVDTQLQNKYQPWQSDDPSAPYYRPIYTALNGGSLQSTSTGVWMNPRATIDAIGSDSCKITKERKDET